MREYCASRSVFLAGLLAVRGIVYTVTAQPEKFDIRLGINDGFLSQLLSRLPFAQKLYSAGNDVARRRNVLGHVGIGHHTARSQICVSFERRIHREKDIGAVGRIVVG